MHNWPVLVHNCEACQYNTTLENPVNAWTQDHTCNHCGDSSRGADVAGRSADSMNYQQHDELAALFAQSMQLAPRAVASPPPPAPVMVATMISEKRPDTAPPIHFISSHYTHTVHIRPDAPVSEPSRSPPPSYLEAIIPEALADTLRQHSIDPTALLPNQVHLFANADPEQRLRLLELWRIAPPSYRERPPQPDERLMATSLQREEAEAQTRYERLMRARALRREEHMFDTFVPDEQQQPPPHAEVEPYIMHGYEAAQLPRALDPVYAAAPGLWQMPSYAQPMQQQWQQQEQERSTMADQYGMVQQIRNHADWERMNQQAAQYNHPADDEMVM